MSTGLNTPSAYEPRHTRGHDRSTERTAQLGGIILLAGSIKPRSIEHDALRSVLDLPFDQDTTILERWHDELSLLGTALNREPPPARIMLDQRAYAPNMPASLQSMRALRDPNAMRGTGGVLRDIADDYDDDHLLLVVNGLQILTTPLHRLATEMLNTDADVVLIAHDDGAPVSSMLVRCGVLRHIAPIGFVDFKEQALPQIAETHRVLVLHHRCASGKPIQTRQQYITALRAAHLTRATDTAFTECWASGFGFVEDEAEVDPTAHLHDVVVLRGAKVEAGAMIVRSIVCANQVIRRGQTVTDCTVSAAATPDGRVVT